MSYNISKELFKEITGNDETINEHNKECIINGNTEEYISFNDFYFMCKEWAIKENRENKIINNGDHFYINHIGSWMIGYFENYQCDVGYRGKNKDETFADLTKHFTADSEQQAVFDACQWILDNKEK